MLRPIQRKNTIEAGCDEAGRGCLAGPVYAAAVILPDDYFNHELNDSKQLSEKKRDRLRAQIEKEAISFAVASASVEEIDEINILNASYRAMHKAIAKLKPIPEHLLIDGNRFQQYPDIKHTCIIKGDGLYYSIAAASVLAKTYRDEFMRKIDSDFPDYGWSHNKGYATFLHRNAIAIRGITKWHRRTFQLLDQQLKIEF